MNNNNQTSPGAVIAAIVFIALAVAFNFMVDSTILSMIFAAGVLAVLALIVFGCITFWQKVDKKKFTKYSIIIGSSILGVLIAIGIANACIPTLSQEDVKALVIEDLEPQMDKVKKELDISNVSLELEIYDYEYKKPTIFSKGYIRFEIDDFYVSSEFEELDNGIYNEDTCNKYRGIHSIEYDHVEIPKYRVYISRRLYSDPKFKDASGDSYSFDYGVIYKNGSYVYGGKSYSSSSSYSGSSSTKTKCSRCSGTGRVTKSYGKSWSKIEGYGYGDVCGGCGGTGYK